MRIYKWDSVTHSSDIGYDRYIISLPVMFTSDNYRPHCYRVLHITNPYYRCNIFPEFNFPLQWRHNGRDGVSSHQSHQFLLNCLFGRRSKKTSKFCVTGLCAGNLPGTGEFSAHMAGNAENVSIWWRHHADSPPPPLTVIGVDHARVYDMSWLRTTIKHIHERVDRKEVD